MKRTIHSSFWVAMFVCSLFGTNCSSRENCQFSQDCNALQPFCVAGKCVECEKDKDCSADKTCESFFCKPRFQEVIRENSSSENVSKKENTQDGGETSFPEKSNVPWLETPYVCQGKQDPNCCIPKQQLGKTILTNYQASSRGNQWILESKDGKYLITTNTVNHWIRVWDIAKKQLYKVLTEHPAEITSIDLSPKGDFLASSDKKGNVYVWKTHTWSLEKQLSDTSLSLSQVLWSADEKWLVAVGEQGYYFVWDIAKQYTLHLKQKIHTSTITQAVIHPTQSIVWSMDYSSRALKKVDIVTLKELWGQTVSVKRLISIAVSSDGNQVATGRNDGTVEIISSGGVLVKEFSITETVPSRLSFEKSHPKLFVMGYKYLYAFSTNNCALEKMQKLPEPLQDIAFSSAVGSPLWLSSKEQNVLLWDWQQETKLFALFNPYYRLDPVSYSADGAWIFKGSSLSNDVQIWKRGSTEKPSTVALETGGALSIESHPHLSQLLVGGQNGKIYLWDSSTQKTIQSYSTGQLTITQLLWLPSGDSFLASSLDGKVVWIDTKTHQTKQTFSFASPVTAIALQKDLKALVVAFPEQMVLWDMALNKEIKRNVLLSPAMSLSLSSDNTLLAVASLNSKVGIWDMALWEPSKELLGHGGMVTGVFFTSDNRLFSISEDFSFVEWDVQREMILQKTFQRNSYRTSMDFSTQFQSFVISTMDGNMDEINIQKREYPTIAKGGDGNALQYSASRSYFLLSNQKTVEMWDAKEGKKTTSFVAHDKNVSSILWNHSKNAFLTLSEDHSAKLWDAKTFALKQSFLGHTGTISAAVFSTDDSILWTASQDGTVKKWEVAKGTELLSHFQKVDSFLTLYLSADEKDYFVGSYKGFVYKVNALDGQILTTYNHTDGVNSLLVLPELQKMFVASNDKLIWVWDLKTDKVIEKWNGHLKAVTHLLSSPDNQTIISTSWDQTIRFWDLEKGDNYKTIASFSTKMALPVWKDDFRIFVTSLEQKIVEISTQKEERNQSYYVSPTGISDIVWNESKQEVLASLQSNFVKKILLDDLENHSFMYFDPTIFSMAVGKDLLLLAQNKENLQLNSAQDYKYIASISGHSQPLTSVAFSPDEKWFASGSQDTTIRLYQNIEKYPLFFIYRKHEKAITDLHFSKDSQWLVSGDAGGKFIVWDVQKGTVVHEASTKGAVASVQFSPYNDILAVGDQAGTLQIIKTTSWKLLFSQELSSGIQKIRFHPKGLYLVVSLEKGELGWLDLIKQELSFPFSFQNAPFTGVAWTSKALLLGDADGIFSWRTCLP